jgi:hypothetical protein
MGERPHTGDAIALRLMALDARGARGRLARVLQLLD